MITKITTHEEHKEALAEFERLWSEADRLADLIAAYEDIHYQIGDSNESD